MKIITNSRFTSLVAKVMLAFSLLLTSCSESPTANDEEVNGGGKYTVKLSESELIDSDDFGKILYTAAIGVEWSAEIVEGEDFVSFSSRETLLAKSGVSTSDNEGVIYFYCKVNNNFEDREATINVTFDDAEPIALKLIQLRKGANSDPYNDAAEPRWFEIPTKKEQSNYLYVSHSAELKGERVRNFSVCFDINNHASAWVAFPYHKVYDGNVGRCEEWEYDPLIPEEYQANLCDYSYRGNYDRGHQMASADRQATVELNEQTFYFSNMTPQLDNLNRYEWAQFEGNVRDQVCADTLYVVTGADFTTTIGSTTDADGKKCPLPGAYYKVLLRTRMGDTGKAISECKASELKAIGFWFEHKKYSDIPDPISVAEIEKRTGFNFFPSVPQEVKESFSKNDWNF